MDTLVSGVPIIVTLPPRENQEQGKPTAHSAAIRNSKPLLFITGDNKGAAGGLL
jgi:hypothetical protein